MAEGSVGVGIGAILPGDRSSIIACPGRASSASVRSVRHDTTTLQGAAARVVAACALLAALGLALIATTARAAAPAPVESQKADDLILTARDTARSGDVERLGLILRRLQTIDPNHPLAAWPEYWALNIRLKRTQDGNDNLPEATVREFLSRNAGSVAADLARRDWLLVLGKRRDFATFDAELPRFVLNDDAQVTCYDLLSRHLRQEDVLERARLALAQPRDFGDGCQALAETLVTARKIDADELWAWVRHAFDANALTAARKFAALLPPREAPAPGVLEAIYDRSAQWLARSHGAPATRLQRELATLALVRMARADPEPTAALWQRTWAPRLPTELRAVVWAQLAAAGARRFLSQSTEWSNHSLPAKLLSEDVLSWQVRGALRAQDWKLVQKLIDKMPPDMRRARGEGTWQYWLARALKAEGRTDEAALQLRAIANQFHFYGQLALEDLGERIVVPPPPPAVTEAELNAVKDLPGFARSLRFYQINLRPLGNLEWNFTVRGMTDRQLLAAAEHARRNAILDRAVNTADRTRAEHDFATRFLAPYRDQLQPKVEALGLDLAWVYGLIRQESRFITNARSSAGAAGLMQVMPATARYVARRIGLDPRAAGLDDAEANLVLGTNYLRMVLTDLDSSPLLATAGYNAGPGRPRAWRASLARPIEGAIFAETIPFNETRDYVKKVMSNAVYYAALFEGKPQSLRARIGTVIPKGYAETSLP